MYLHCKRSHNKNEREVRRGISPLSGWPLLEEDMCDYYRSLTGIKHHFWCEHMMKVWWVKSNGVSLCENAKNKVGLMSSSQPPFAFRRACAQTSVEIKPKMGSL